VQWAAMTGGAEVTINDTGRNLLRVACFWKGGLFGAYVPFFSLWLFSKGYDMGVIGMFAVLDLCATAILLPLIGGVLDAYQVHNKGLVAILVTVGVTKYSMLHFYNKLWVLVILTVISAPFVKASNAVLDSLCLYAFPHKGEFPKVRMWGSVGFGCFALLAGFVVDAAGSVDIVIVVFAVSAICAAIFWAVIIPYIPTLRQDASGSAGEYFQNLRVFAGVLNWTVLRVIIVLALCGAALGVIGAYEFILLKELGAPTMLMGLCRFSGCILEMVCFWYCAPLMDRIGLLNVQLLALTGTAIRLFIYATLTNPWHALGAEVFHGCTFALPYASIAVFAGQHVPEELKGSVQSVLLSTMVGLGTGGGAFLGGLFADAFTVQLLFYWAAVATAAVAGFCYLVDILRWATGHYVSAEDSMLPAAPADPSDSVFKPIVQKGP